VSEYVLDHYQEGERQRLALMSQLLDPMHRRHLEELGVEPRARTLEVGCGNGSMSAWLAGRIAPGGRAVAVRLADSGHLDGQLIDAFLARCTDAAWWTQTIAFTAVHGRVAGADR
jgi:hypothetical protein